MDSIKEGFIHLELAIWNPTAKLLVVELDKICDDLRQASRENLSLRPADHREIFDHISHIQELKQALQEEPDEEEFLPVKPKTLYEDRVNNKPSKRLGKDHSTDGDRSEAISRGD